MRAATVVLAAFVLAGCGGGGESPERLGADAARLVPPDAIAFASVDARDREAWQTVRDLTGVTVTGTGKVHYALVDLGSGDPVRVTLVRSGDDVKVRNFPVPLGRREVRIEEIGDRAQSGRSLADEKHFQAAMAELDDDALATAYVDRAAVEQLPDEFRALVGSPPWIAAQLATDDDAVRVQAHSPSGGPDSYRPRLLREVPSGAVLALSFRDFPRLPKGEGVLYVVPSALIPIVVLTIENPTPKTAARVLERLATQIRVKTGGALAVHVITTGNRVTLTNGLGPVPNTGGRLVDDPPFKDALVAADVPEEVTWLAYADVDRLLPLLRALSPDAAWLPRLERLETLVAFGARSGSKSRVELRLTGR